MTSSELERLHTQYQSAVQAGDLGSRRLTAEALTRQYPDMADGFAKLAHTLLALDRDEDAARILSGAIAKFTGDRNFPFLMGMVLVRAGQHLQAVPYFRRAVELKPAWGEANFHVALCLTRGGSVTEAIEFFARAIAAEPRNIEYRAARASALITLDRFDEARAELRAALGLDPSRDDLRRMLEDIKDAGIKSPGKAPKIKRSKWPAAVTEFSDLRAAIKRYVVNDYDTRGFVLKPRMSVMTQGSCFARNLADGFRRYPLEVANVPLGEEHNSPFANAAILRWLVDGAVDDETRMAEANLGADKRDIYRRFLARTDLYVFTMGVAPVFFDRKTGRFQMPHANATSAIHLARNCVFRSTTVAENVERLTYIVDAVKSINPKIRAVITVSPVPLNTTLEISSPVIADCLSKSTLRLAAHEVSQASDGNVQYWPSFEIVRWLAAHHGVVFGGDDGSSFHVNESVVEAIVDSFVDVFGAPDLKVN